MKRTLFPLFCTAVIAASVGFLASKAMTLVPSTQPLTFTGRLTNNGAPMPDAARAVHVAVRFGSTVVCETVSGPEPSVTFTDGRFSVPLPDCVAEQVALHGDLEIQLTVTGAGALPWTKLGAVPYAMEAKHADTATNADGTLATQTVPQGAVMAFDLAACPTGWVALEATPSGVAIINLGPGLVRGTVVGANSVTLSTNELPSHDHGVNDPTHSHTPINGSFIVNTGSVGTLVQGGGAVTIYNNPNTNAVATGITIQSAGSGQPFDNRQRSLPLLYCKKT